MNHCTFLSSARTFTVALVISLLIIAVVSSVFAYEYAGLSSELSSRDSAIASLSSTISSQDSSISSLDSNVTSQASSISTLDSIDASQANSILNLQLMLNSMSAQIRTLNSTVAALDSNQTGLTAQQQALELKLSDLETASSELQTELSAVEQAGQLSVVTFFANDTMMVPGNSNITVTQQLNGHNGTIILLSPDGCPIPGITYGPNPTGSSYYILFKASNSSVSILATVATESVSPSPFILYLSNIGATSVHCTFSLYWVYQDSS
jgi:trimeric autotransporter adhesin